MIFFWYALDVLLMIGFPLWLARLIHRRRRPSWELFMVGGATFILSQVGHIPFNWLALQKWALLPTDTAVPRNLIILALFLGLSAGLFEEVGRYLTCRFWAKEARSWGTGLMLGAGHGGVEAILVGFVTLLNVGALATMRDGSLLNQISTEQLPVVQAQIEAVFAAPWYLILMGALERVFAITFHLSASLLVMQAFVRGQIRWLGFSILWHTVLNFTAVYAAVTWNVFVTEALLGVFALFSLGLIFWLRRPEPAAADLSPLPDVELVRPLSVALDAEALDRSRYL